MADCKYCTNYYLNSHARLDNVCMGYGDCRKEYFYCNQRLKPNTLIEDETEEIVEEPQSETTESKTIVDYLREHGKFVGCFNGYEITLYTVENYNWTTMQFNATQIIMEVGGYKDDKCNDKYTIEIEGNTPMYEIQDVMYDEYDTEIRFCSECGKPYDAGYMAGDGDWYYCEDCFEDTMNKDYGKGKWRPTDCEGECGGYYEHLNEHGKWEDTGIFYTEWN